MVQAGAIDSALGEINDTVISQLLQLEVNFTQNTMNPNDSIRYQAFPSQSNDKYNSNSFISGLLIGAGFENVSDPTFNVPGWNKPVPLHLFSLKEE